MAETEQLGSSYIYGKVEAANFIKDQFFNDNIQRPLILDVGAGGAAWIQFFEKESYDIEAVDIWEPAVEFCKTLWYKEVYLSDIRNFEYPKIYDLIIFGDIIEHLPVEDAQQVLQKASHYGRHILVAVPFMCKQDVIYGNEAEKHIQDDLTYFIFKERYPGFKLIFGRADMYGYFYK